MRCNLTVALVPHPMEEKHFTDWIGLQAGGASRVQFLKPGATAEAVFKVDAAEAGAREYCSVHGLRKA